MSKDCGRTDVVVRHLESSRSRRFPGKPVVKNHLHPGAQDAIDSVRKNSEKEGNPSSCLSKHMDERNRRTHHTRVARGMTTATKIASNDIMTISYIQICSKMTS